jgi:hypothetical protein
MNNVVGGGVVVIVVVVIHLAEIIHMYGFHWTVIKIKLMHKQTELEDGEQNTEFNI